ncbi:hypothetical protein ACHAXM_007602 [Skeletonema potamos]
MKVNAFASEVGSLNNIPVVDAVIVYDCPFTGESYFLLMYNCLYIPSMECHLIPPFILREAGLLVNDTPKIQSMKPDEDTHVIYDSESEMRIHLGLNGIFSYFKCRSIAEDEMRNWQQYKVVESTPMGQKWDPYNPVYREEEEAMVDGRGEVLQKTPDRIARFNLIEKDDWDQEAELQSSYSFEAQWIAAEQWKPVTKDPSPSCPLIHHTTKSGRKIQHRIQRRAALRAEAASLDQFFDETITDVEDQRTATAKADTNNCFQCSISTNHNPSKRASIPILQRGRNCGLAASAAIRRLTNRLSSVKHVQIHGVSHTQLFHLDQPASSSLVGIQQPRQVFQASPGPSNSGLTPGLSNEEAIRAAKKRARRKRNKLAKRMQQQAEELATRQQRQAEEAARAQTIPTRNSRKASLDSAADDHFVTEEDRIALNLPILGPSMKRVAVANGGIEQGKYQTILPLPNLPPEARLGDSFDSFSNSLISVGRLAGAGTTSIFTKTGVEVHKDEDVLILVSGKPLLVGKRDEHGRYKIPLLPTRDGTCAPKVPTRRTISKLSEANNVYDLPSTEQAIRWFHATLGYPVRSTWLKAIKNGHFRGWPLLTERNVKRYYPETDETPMGHLSQRRKNVRSTKPKVTPTPFEEADVTLLRHKKERDILVKVYDVRETVFSDQTGRLPKRSQRGNKYIMVLVEIDSNAIFLEPLSSRKDSELQRAYESILKRLKRAGIVPKKHILDNEISESMKALIRDKYNMTFELVPPGTHRRNAAEVAIRNVKTHLLSILAGVADDFQMGLWDRLLPQAELTLNLLRSSNATPNVSAYAHVYGNFDYNKMPLAPMGCKVHVHQPTDSRHSWDYHLVQGWYLFTSPEHYRTHNCHIKETKKERMSDSVQFQHKLWMTS